MQAKATINEEKPCMCSTITKKEETLEVAILVMEEATRKRTTTMKDNNQIKLKIGVVEEEVVVAEMVEAVGEVAVHTVPTLIVTIAANMDTLQEIVDLRDKKKRT